MAFSQKSKRKILYIYLIASVFFLASFVFGILLGSTKLSLIDMLRALISEHDSPEARIFLYVRLPRTCAALVCGAALAVSGAVIQCALANRLASPSIIGVNSGAGLAVTLCSAFGTVGGISNSFFAFVGAFTAALVVALASRRFGASRGTVILIGVAISSLFGAVTDTVTVFVPDVAVMRNDFRIGSFSGVTYRGIIPSFIIVLLVLMAVMILSNKMDVLTLGDETATSLGLNTASFRILLLVLTSLLAGAAVSIAGLLSFVGLIVPHAVRRLSFAASKHLVALSALFGGGLVALSDTFARFIFAPYEIPVGIVMSFIGVPVFLLILLKGKGGERRA